MIANQPVLAVAGQGDGAVFQREDPEFQRLAPGFGDQRDGQFGIGQPRQHPRPKRCLGIVERTGGKIVKRGHGPPFHRVPPYRRDPA